MVRVIDRKKITNMKNNVLSVYSDTHMSLSYLGIYVSWLPEVKALRLALAQPYIPS